METMDAKLAFLARLCLARAEKMLVLFAHGNGEALVMPNGTSEGDLGVPNEVRKLLIAAFAGLTTSFGGANIRDCFLHGVSGIWALGKPASSSSVFRFLLEMRPVDIKAAGSGLAALYAAGVANEPWEEN